MGATDLRARQLRKPLTPEDEELARLLGHASPRTESVPKPDILWTEQGSFLIRRIDGAYAFPNFKTRKVTLYVPAVGGAVDEDALTLFT